MTVIIHPNSPSGELMELPKVEAVVQAAQAEGGVVLVDESFMPHMGPNWHHHSVLTLVEKYPTTIIVVNSWTKIWCCPGLRLGSVACAEHWYKIMKKNQTPWSCNNMEAASARLHHYFGMDVQREFPIVGALVVCGLRVCRSCREGGCCRPRRGMPCALVCQLWLPVASAPRRPHSCSTRQASGSMEQDARQMRGVRCSRLLARSSCNVNKPSHPH